MSERFHHSVTEISRPRGTSEDAWDLYCGAAKGHLPAIRECIGRNQELIHHQIWYEFPIHFAVRGGHVDAVQILLDAGTNPAWSYFRYSSWQKLLPIAQRRGHEEIHKILVAEMKRRFNFDPGYQPLFKAIGESADIDAMRRIIAERPELVHVGDEHGNRALHWAVLARRIPMIEHLLDAGADIHARRADLQTPLHLSIKGGDYWFESSDNREPNVKASTITDLLLERGANYEFSLAVHRGDLERINEMLAEDPEAATRLNDSRRSPLGIAANAGQMEVVKLLLELGADPNLPEECCPLGAALMNVCWRCDVEMARLLLENGADPRGFADSSGDCFSAAEHNKQERTDEFVQLLKEFSDRKAWYHVSGPEALSHWMQTDESIATDEAEVGGLLRKVIETKDVALLAEFIERFGEEPIRTLDPAKGWNLVDDPQFLDLLVQHGMDVNRPDWLGRTFLHYCAERPDGIALAGQYLDRGIDVNAIDFMTGTTALGFAAKKDNVAMVRYLLERGADPLLPAEHEWAQPKNLADGAGHWKSERVIRTSIVLKQLAQDPASLFASDPTVLHRSAHYSEEEIVEAALAAGASIEAEHPSMGGRPLHWATEGNVKICRQLVERGAEVNSRVVSEDERNGMTPLIYCAWWCGDDDECIRIAEFLIEAGADINARDANGKSAVERALQQGHNDLAAALKALGCA